MPGFHAFFFQFQNFFVHVIVISSGNTNFHLHGFERFIGFKFCWYFIQFLDGLCLNIFYLGSGDCSDECVSDIFIGLPYCLQVVPNFSQQLDIFAQIFKFLHVSRLQS